MSTSISRPVPQPERFGQLWWLPSGGLGNGIDDRAWAPILDVGADLVAPLLAALRIARVPAYAANVPATPSWRAARGHAAPRCRIWVGTSAHGRAEETLVAVLPSMTGSASRPGVGRRP